MFDIFGEFDTAEDINKTAIGLKDEGDLENISILAKENGIDLDIVEAFIEGDIDFIADEMTAAIGKLDIEMQQKEVKQYNSKIPADPIVTYLKTECTKEQMAAAIRKKGKSLIMCLSYIEQEAKKIVTKEKPWLHDSAVYKMAKDYYLS